MSYMNDDSIESAIANAKVHLEGLHEATHTLEPLLQAWIDRKILAGTMIPERKRQTFDLIMVAPHYLIYLGQEETVSNGKGETVRLGMLSVSVPRSFMISPPRTPRLA